MKVPILGILFDSFEENSVVVILSVWNQEINPVNMVYELRLRLGVICLHQQNSTYPQNSVSYSLESSTIDKISKWK